MDVISLVDSIYDNYYDNNFEKVIQEIEQYLKLHKVGIFDTILNIYILSLINLGLLDKASKNIDIMRNLYPYYYEDLNLAIKYSKCLKIDKLDEILSKHTINKQDYYYIASELFFNENYEKAKQLFYSCLDSTNDTEKKKQIEIFLNKINLYEKDNTIFKEVKYSFFKYKGCKLEPGHIIYVERLRDEFKENTYNEDPKSNTRPYMIWRVINNKIYAFPLSTRIKPKSTSIIDKNKYRNQNFNRVVKDTLTCLEERDINKVMDKIKQEDYERIIKAIYHSICLSHDILKKSTQFFMYTMVKELKIDLFDVIVIPDFSKNIRRYYLVLSYDGTKQKYRVIEVLPLENNNYEVVSKEISTISNKVAILNVIKLDINEKDKIISKVPINFRNENMLRKIVNYNNRNLVIMMEKDEYYICLDQTFKCLPSFILIDFIRKDIPLNIIGSLPRENWEQQLYILKDYIKNNSNDFHNKKLTFLKNRRY